jgi:hypothetical protein
LSDDLKFEALFMHCTELWQGSIDKAARIEGPDTAVRAYLLTGMRWALEHGYRPGGLAEYFRALASLLETGKGTQAFDEMAALAQRGLKQQKAMDAGRTAGVKARQAKQRRKEAALERAIAPWSRLATRTRRILSHLMERKLSPYSRASTEAHMKRIAARLGKAARLKPLDNRQACRFPHPGNA